MLAVTLHCKIDHVDTTTASSKSGMQEVTQRTDEDGKYRSDGGKENRDRGTYSFHIAFIPRLLALTEKAVNKATVCQIHNTEAQGSVKHFSVQQEQESKKHF